MIMDAKDRQTLLFLLQRLEGEVFAWSYNNFGNQPAYRSLLGVTEELGELTHAHLKCEQGIRGYTVEDQSERVDAIGDLIIYLFDYCARSKMSLAEALLDTWDKVSKRDWTRYPKNGVSK